MGEPKKKPGTQPEERNGLGTAPLCDAACGGDCIDSDWRGGDVFRENNRHSGEKGWLTGRNGGYRRIWNGD